MCEWIVVSRFFGRCDVLLTLNTILRNNRICVSCNQRYRWPYYFKKLSFEYIFNIICSILLFIRPHFQHANQSFTKFFCTFTYYIFVRRITVLSFLSFVWFLSIKLRTSLILICSSILGSVYNTHVIVFCLSDLF